jgi:hypothetical protein
MVSLSTATAYHDFRKDILAGGGLEGKSGRRKIKRKCRRLGWPMTKVWPENVFANKSWTIIYSLV